MPCGNFGGMELLILVGLAILFFGPAQIPKLARGIGESIKTMRRATRELESQMDEAKEEANETKRVLVQELRGDRERGPRPVPPAVVIRDERQDQEGEGRRQ